MSTKLEARRSFGRPPYRHSASPPARRASCPSATPLVGPRPSASGPRPRVDGKFLAVGAERLWLAGVTYGTFAPAEDGAPYGEPRAGRRGLPRDGRERRQRRCARTRCRRAGCSTRALRHGLWVTVGLPWEQHVAFLDSRRRARVDRGARPRRRPRLRRPPGRARLPRRQRDPRLDRALARPRQRSSASSSGCGARPSRRTPTGSSATRASRAPSTSSCRGLDFVSYNVYLEDPERLAAYLARLQNLAGERPLVMTELGLDSRRNGREAQARALREQVRASFAGGCAGTFLFAWTDEWHTGGAEVTDWDFGLVDRARRPKPALAAARGAYADLPLGGDRAGATAPRVSVVVCTLNGAATIGETLDAVERLEYPDFEVIVVDDGSTDATAEIVAAHPHVRLHPHAEPRPQRGAQHRPARGDRRDRRLPRRRRLPRPALARLRRARAARRRARRRRRAEPAGPARRARRRMRRERARRPGARAAERHRRRAHPRLQHGVPQRPPRGDRRLRRAVPRRRRRRRRLLAAAGARLDARLPPGRRRVASPPRQRARASGASSAATGAPRRCSSARGRRSTTRPGTSPGAGASTAAASAPLRRSRVYYGTVRRRRLPAGIEQPQPLLLALACGAGVVARDRRARG